MGTYTGNGATTQTIKLGFMPKFLWVWETGTTAPFDSAYDVCSAICIPGHPAVHYNNNTALQITDTGFIAAYKPSLGNNYDIFLNEANSIYAYLALA